MIRKKIVKIFWFRHSLLKYVSRYLDICLSLYSWQELLFCLPYTCSSNTVTSNFLNWPSSVSFSFFFRLFKQKLLFGHQIKCEKCPFSILYLDLSTRPSEHESPPIATGPGLPPQTILLQRLFTLVLSNLKNKRVR